MSREEVALIEVGQTAITRPMVWTLVAVFLATIFLVPVVQSLHAARRPAADGERPSPSAIIGDVARAVRSWPATTGRFYQRVYRVNAGLLRDMHRYEDDLEDNSWLTHALLPPVQAVLTRVFGAGNEQAYPGLGGWLYYRPDVDTLTGPGFLGPRELTRRMGFATEWQTPPQPDPVKAIVQFRDQLRRRGVELVVMPVPGKAAIHPEQFVRAYRDRSAALQNPSHAPFVAALRRQGVRVFEVADELAAERARGRPQFLATDTHWRPEVVESVAARLRDFIAAHRLLPPAPAAGYTSAGADVAGRGDVAVMLKLPPGQTLYPSERVRLRQILTPRNEFWRATPAADVLLLGDSFSNIYALDGMGWGEAAGLAEQLSFELQRPVDRIVLNDHGAFATRAALARELARGRDRLAGKRLVIYQFAARELSTGDWKLIDLALGTPAPAKFATPATGTVLTVRATVAAVAPAPRPGTVPYKDHVVAAHLVDVEDDAGGFTNGQALAYMLSMQDNRWTPAARYRPGDVLKLRLRAWSDVAPQYEGLNRTELDETDLQMQEPCWGEPVR